MRVRYATDEQSFEEIRKNNSLYVDKTSYVYRLTHETKYAFLSRPRRFGKSLLVSTLQCYFEARRELFEGLVIGELEKKWIAYPVLHFDMSKGRNFNSETLTEYLEHQLKEHEEKFGVCQKSKSINLRFDDLIKAVYNKTGKQVVVLIDEYDSPVLGSLHKSQLHNEIRGIMSNFYSPLKGNTNYLQFVFITGIAKFSQLSIFSEFNNLNIISMDKAYSAICGITKVELESQMKPDIAALAEELGISP